MMEKGVPWKQRFLQFLRRKIARTKNSSNRYRLGMGKTFIIIFYPRAPRLCTAPAVLLIGKNKWVKLWKVFDGETRTLEKAVFLPIGESKQ